MTVVVFFGIPIDFFAFTFITDELADFEVGAVVGRFDAGNAVAGATDATGLTVVRYLDEP